MNTHSYYLVAPAMSIKYDLVVKSMPADTTYDANIVIAMSALKEMSRLIDHALLTPAITAHKSTFDRMDKLCADNLRCNNTISGNILNDCRKTFVVMWVSLGNSW